VGRHGLKTHPHPKGGLSNTLRQFEQQGQIVTFMFRALGFVFCSSTEWSKLSCRYFGGDHPGTAFAHLEDVYNLGCWPAMDGKPDV
jgi:hypothetical protein